MTYLLQQKIFLTQIGEFIKSSGPLDEGASLI